MPDLKDAAVIITGASSGIGEATALELANRGAKLMLAARRADRLDALVEKLSAAGSSVLAQVCDVSRRTMVEAMVERTVGEFGRVDVLINNAGIMPVAPLALARVEEWDDMIDINVKGVLYGIAAVLPIMNEQGSGHILNVSSIAGRKVFPGGVVYCATKHAVHAISEGLRYELGERVAEDGNRIRVTTIAPGVVETELPDSIRMDGAREAFKGYVKSLRDPLQSEDIAAAILYALEAPEHVDVNEILIRPQSQVR